MMRRTRAVHVAGGDAVRRRGGRGGGDVGDGGDCRRGRLRRPVCVGGRIGPARAGLAVKASGSARKRIVRVESIE